MYTHAEDDNNKNNKMAEATDGGFVVVSCGVGWLSEQSQNTTTAEWRGPVRFISACTNR